MQPTKLRRRFGHALRRIDTNPENARRHLDVCRREAGGAQSYALILSEGLARGKTSTAGK
jgi:hypothetical protein